MLLLCALMCVMRQCTLTHLPVYSYPWPECMCATASARPTGRPGCSGGAENYVMRLIVYVIWFRCTIAGRHLD